MKTFSTKEAIKAGWAKTREHISFLLLVTVIMWAFSIVGEMVYDSLKNGSSGTAVDYIALGGISLIITFVSVIMQIGYLKIYLKLYDGQDAQIEDLYTHHSLVWKFLGAGILSGLMIMIGFLALIIPGIIVSVAIGFQQLVTVDKEVSPIAAIKKSFAITKGVRWHLFWFMLTLVLVNLLGVLALVVGVLVTIPVTIFAMIHVYRILLSQTEEQVIPTPSTVTPVL